MPDLCQQEIERQQAMSTVRKLEAELAHEREYSGKMDVVSQLATNSKMDAEEWAESLNSKVACLMSRNMLSLCLGHGWLQKEPYPDQSSCIGR